MRCREAQRVSAQTLMVEQTSGLESWLHWSPAVWPWTCHLTPLCFCFASWKMEISGGIYSWVVMTMRSLAV